MLPGVLDALDDDTARLAAADIARENGDAAGYFLQRDVEAVRLRAIDPHSRATAVAVLEAEALRARHTLEPRRWGNPSISSERGLAHGATATARQVLDGTVERNWVHFPTLRQLAVSPTREPALAHRTMTWLASTPLPIHDLRLAYFGLRPRDMRLLATSPLAPQLRALRFSNGDWFSPDRYMDLGDPMPRTWRTLFRSPSQLFELRLLDIRVKPNALLALAEHGGEAVFRNTLEELHVGTSAHRRTPGVEHVAAVLGQLPRLTRLEWFFPPVATDFRVLGRAAGAEQLQRLAITFTNNDLDEELAQIFDPTGRLVALSTLQLHGDARHGYVPGTLRQRTPFAASLRELELDIELPSIAFEDLFHPRSAYRGLRKLVIRSRDFTSDSLRQLFAWKGAESLEELVLRGTGIEDKVFAEIRQRGCRLKNLRILRIHNLPYYESSPSHGFGARCQLESVLDTLVRWPRARRLHTLELSGFQPVLDDDVVEPLRRPQSYLSELVELDLSKNRDNTFNITRPSAPASSVQWTRLHLPELRALGTEGLAVSRPRLFAVLRNRVAFPHLKMIRGHEGEVLTRRGLEE